MGKPSMPPRSASHPCHTGEVLWHGTVQADASLFGESGKDTAPLAGYSKALWELLADHQRLSLIENVRFRTGNPALACPEGAML